MRAIEVRTDGPNRPLLMALLVFGAMCVLLAEAFGGTATVRIDTPAGAAEATMEAEPFGSDFAALEVAGKVYAIARLWDHDGWSEVALSNGSVEDAPGTWQGAYSVEVDGVRVERAGAVFHRGTGFLEVFGEPRLAPTIKGKKALAGFFPAGPCEAAASWARTYGPGAQPSAWPLPAGEWDPAHGAGTGGSPSYDKTPNAHQTGSPRNAGCLPREVAALWIAQSDPQAVRRLGGFLWGWAMNQARRPVTWLHPMTGAVYEASEQPGLTMGDYGPSSAFGSTESFGDPFKSNKSPWTGCEIEHIEADRLAALVALYDSGFAAEQLTAIAEGLLTQRWLRTAPLDPGSTRALFWSAKVLTWQVALSRDLDRRIAAYQGLQRLATTYLAQCRVLPVPHFRRYSPTWATPPSLPKHVAPSLAELEAWCGWRGIEWPGDQGSPFLTALALDKAGKITAPKGVEFEPAAVPDDSGPSEMEQIQDTWSFELVWQVAIGGPVAGFIQRTLGADPRWRQVQEHVAWTVTYARNPGGTFWQEVVPGLVGRHGDKDNGQGREGLSFWLAGGLGACHALASGPTLAKLRADVLSVAGGNKYVAPSNSYGVLYEWFLESAKDAEIAAAIGWKP